MKTFSISLNNGNTGESEDDWDQEVKPLDWWGYTWSQAYKRYLLLYLDCRAGRVLFLTGFQLNRKRRNELPARSLFSC